MSDTDLEAFTPEETEAMEAMKADTGEGIETAEPTPAPEPTPEPAPEREQVAAEAEPADSEGHEASEPDGEPERAAEADGKPPAGFVPHGAMHAERMRAQSAEAAVAQLQERLDALEAAQPQPEPEPAPDPIIDKEAYDAWVVKQAQAPMEALQKMQAEQQQAAEFQRLSAAVGADEQRFMAQKPDYQQAVEHAIESRVKVLSMLFPTAAEADIRQEVQNERISVARQAVESGQSPADIFYRIGQSYGYTPKAPEPAPVQTEAAKVAALASAQQATQTLTAAPGASGAAEITLDYLAGLGDEAYAKLQAERPDDVARALGG
jgi:hypothetical protein